MQQQSNQMEDYIIHINEKPLGSGSYGQIFSCHHKDDPTTEYYAKMIPKKNINEKESQSNKFLNNERNAGSLLKQQKNENLVQIFAIVEDDDYLAIIMEKCDHDLSKEFTKMKSITQSEQIDIIKQILNGAYFLFSNRIIHRDIKPENILVKIVNIGNVQKRIYKISDFGFSRSLQNYYKLANLTRVGTRTHCAPEILGILEFNAKCDIYSYGILFYQIVNKGFLPYKATVQAIHNFITQIKQNQFKFNEKIQGEYGDLLMDLIEKMIVYNIEDRMSFEDLFNHKIFTQTFQIKQESLFKFKPEQIDQNQYQVSKQEQKKLARIDRIFYIQEIFYRKYQLCFHVRQYLDKELPLGNYQKMAIQTLISYIGLYQLRFAYAAYYQLWCDIHQVFKKGNDNEMIKLLEIFKDFNEHSKQDQQYFKQQQLIKKAYFDQVKLCRQDYFSLKTHSVEEDKVDSFKNSNLIGLVSKQIDVQDLCDELIKQKDQLKLEDWYAKINEQIKINIDKICQIEKNQLDIINYQTIELNNIIQI